MIFFLTLWFPAVLSRPYRRLFHGVDPALFRHRLASVGRASRAAWVARPRRVAMALHHRGRALARSLRRHVLLSHRPARGCDLVASRTARMARAPPRRRGRAARHVSPKSIFASLYDYRVLALALVYFGNVACLYGIGFWLPSIVKGFGNSIAATGWIAAIPYVVGFLGMMWWGFRSDRHGERTFHLAGALAHRRGGYRRLGFPGRPDGENDRADDRRVWRLFRAADSLDACRQPFSPGPRSRRASPLSIRSAICPAISARSSWAGSRI